MNKSLISLSFFMLFSLSCSLFAKETIRLTNGEWLPYMSATLKHKGVASRIVSEAFALEGIDVEYTFFPWKRAYALVTNGEFDGSLAWASKKEREKEVYYSKEGVILGQTMFFYKNDLELSWHVKKQNYENLKGLTIGTLIGYKYLDVFDIAVKNKIVNEQKVSTLEINFKKLLNNRIDLLISNNDVAYNVLNQSFSKKEIATLSSIEYNPEMTVYYLILSKKHKKNVRLMKLFNSGLKKLKESGKYDQYYKESRAGDYIN